MRVKRQQARPDRVKTDAIGAHLVVGHDAGLEEEHRRQGYTLDKPTHATSNDGVGAVTEHLVAVKELHCGGVAPAKHCAFGQTLQGAPARKRATSM